MSLRIWAREILIWGEGEEKCKRDYTTRMLELDRQNKSLSATKPSNLFRSKVEKWVRMWYYCSRMGNWRGTVKWVKITVEIKRASFYNRTRENFKKPVN